MARENKQDRIVRTILDQTIEHLHELKSFESNHNIKEMDVERWAQSFLKNCFGYTPSSNYSIRAQETKGKMRPDLTVFKNDKPVFVVEVKKLGFDLSKSDFRSGKVQLSEYLHMFPDVKWGILTNGYEWRMYDFSSPQYGGIEVAAIDLRNENEEIDTSKKSVEEQCYEFLDLHESSFSENSWVLLAKEAMAFSPESLVRAILTSDVVKYISRTIKGEHDYKVNPEVLFDKLLWVVENGLDDVPGWNETKHLELHKFIKSQKRASKKSRRSAKKEVVPHHVDSDANVNPAVNTQTSTDSDPSKVVA